MIAQGIAGSPRAAPRTRLEDGLSPIIEDYQPVLSLLTQGVNVHATRLDALARIVQRLDKQREEAEARAEAEKQAAESRIADSEGRAAATIAALERKLYELEARVDAMPPAFEELRGRSAQLEHTCGQHERELSARATEVAEVREAQAASETRGSSALAAAEAAFHAANAQLREEQAEANATQRRLTMQANSLQESHSQMHGLLNEQQAGISSLRKAHADAAAVALETTNRLAELATSHREVDNAMAQLTDTVQLGLARAVAAAEATRDDSDRVSAALAGLEGWSKRLERVETDTTEAERKMNGAADEMRRSAAHLEASQRTSMLQASQQVALHVKALSGDLIKELGTKASVADTQQLFDAMHRQFLSLREAHKTLVGHVEAQGAAAETVAEEAATAALQAEASLRGSEKLREETQEWVRHQLENRPSAATSAEVRVALEELQQRENDDMQTLLLTAPGASAAATPRLSLAGSRSGTVDSVRALIEPLQARIDALEVAKKRTEPDGGFRLSQRQAEALHEQLFHDLKRDFGQKLPSLDQVNALQATLSAHIQRMPPGGANYPQGRWCWTRGKIKVAGRAQPPLLLWSAEKINTSPATFNFQSDRTYIEVAQAGMYVVSCAVFISGGPTIGITVNGQMVLRRLRSGAGADLTNLVTGASLRDVLSLQAGARVAVSCEVSDHAPKHDAHGLLELKKLW